MRTINHSPVPLHTDQILGFYHSITDIARCDLGQQNQYDGPADIMCAINKSLRTVFTWKSMNCTITHSVPQIFYFSFSSEIQCRLRYRCQHHQRQQPRFHLTSCVVFSSSVFPLLQEASQNPKQHTERSIQKCVSSR